MKSSRLEPTLWRTCRVLTHLRRLHMLHMLKGLGEACVTDIADRSGVSVPRAAHHLRQLQARGLIRARRASRWVYYSTKPDPKVHHAAELLQILLPAITDGDGRLAVRRALTAYTHPRRIAIVRALAAGPRSPEQVAVACRVSRPAMTRHLRKLCCRGVLVVRRGVCALVSPESQFSERLLAVILGVRRLRVSTLREV